MRRVIFLSLIVVVGILYLLVARDEPAQGNGAEREQIKQDLPAKGKADQTQSELDFLDESQSIRDGEASDTLSHLPQKEPTKKSGVVSDNPALEIPYCVDKDTADDELEQLSQDWENVMQRVDELNKKASEQELGDLELELARILALYVEDENGKIEAISNYLVKYPQSEIASLVLLMECSSNPKHSYCIGLVEKELANQTRYSFSHMLNLIALVIQAGEREVEADRLMTESTSLPNFQEHYSSIIDLMYRYYTILGAPENKMDKISISVTVASVNFINFYPVIQYCKKNAGKRQLVAESCINIGGRLEKFGETMIAQIFGTVFQTEAYKALGNTELAEAATARKNAMNAYRTSELFTRAASLIQYDEQILDVWLNSLLNGTELSAFEAVIEKAKELAKDPSYNPCASKLGTF